MKIPPRVAALVDRIREWPPAVRLQRVMDSYNAAGGGLLAEGLAYSALFGVTTGLLFAVGLMGFIVTDVATRERLVVEFTAPLPAIAPLVRDGLLVVSQHAGALSIIGLVGLGWGSSHFYGALDAAFARIFLLAPARGALDRIARGLVSVALLVTAVVAGVALGGIQNLVGQEIPADSTGNLARLVNVVGFPILAVLLTILGVAVTYRVLPNTHVPLRTLGPPAVVTGIVLALLTELFVFLATRLIGSLAVFGSFAAGFAALAWLSIGFQVMLIGAAWTRVRLWRDEPSAKEGPTVAP
ncbi:MAG TPA: YihY/virulence factor BrkB family protein [Vicinamibacterales bacterium]|nr:YihY/virulence factor BrkB family protein [Vicinamibacterales bacterium]